jgi:hypothetical protein
VNPQLQTPRLTLLPASPEAILALIDQPERFHAVTGEPAADGLRGFFVSAEVSPEWRWQLCPVAARRAYCDHAARIVEAPPRIGSVLWLR